MAYSDIDSGKVLNKEGLLELCSVIKSEIANNSSGGGASYTAGDGIDIDANGVISRTHFDLGEPIWSIFNSGLLPNFSIGSVSMANNVTQLAENLKRDRITQINSPFVTITPNDLNTAMGTAYPVLKFTIDGAVNNIVSSSEYVATSTNNINSNQLRVAVGFMIVGNNIICVNNGVSGLRSLIGYNLGKIIQLSSYNSPNFNNANRLDLVLKALDTAISSKQDAIIPSAPSTDGTYTLQCVVSDGIPTYSWVSAS